MANRSSIFLGVCVLIGSLVFGLASNRPIVGQVPGVPAQAYQKPGRFQLLPVGMGQANNNTIVLWDTESGQAWVNQASSNNRWIDLGTPVPAAKILRGY